MRPRRSSVVRRALLFALTVAAAAAPRMARAQSGQAVEGAPDFVLPTGARVLGMGQAAAATAIGSEALWWNPALVSRGPREVAFGFVSNVLLPVSDITAAVVYPIPSVMTLAFSLRYLNNGSSDATVDQSGQVGTFTTRTTTAMATFAAPFGDRLAIGVNFKVLGVSFDCTGVCNTPTNVPVTGALDFGGQYIFTKDSLLTLGVSIRNVGPPLQINDAPQADPLPGRADVGVAYSPRLAQYPGARLQIAGDVVTRLNGEGGPGFRFGAELSWLGQLQGRLGYVVEGPNGSGPSFGLGVARGRWRADFAQFLSDQGGEGGQKPTYFTLRYVF